MKIAVLIKQVPDTSDVKMDPQTGTMIREGVGAITNPLDLNAIEEAVKIKSQKGAYTVAISMGPKQAEKSLKDAISRGIDTAYLITDKAFAGSDTLATANVLSAALKKLGPFDLILAGEKATDGETGQVGPEVAALLDIPFTTYATSIKIEDGYVVVKRSIEEGHQVQKLPLPCLITVLHTINKPSIPTLGGKKRARRTSIPHLTLKDLNLKKEEVGLLGSPTQVIKIQTPKISRKTLYFGPNQIEEGLNEIIKLLKKENLL